MESGRIHPVREGRKCMYGSRALSGVIRFCIKRKKKEEIYELEEGPHLAMLAL